MIEVRRLRHEYDGFIAIERLDLEIAKGEVFGLIGPNGAGKTTLIRILSTLLEPTYGQVTIGGVDVVSNPLGVHPLIGYMSDFFSLYDQMLVWEYLDHFARCYHIERRRREKLIDEVLELISLTEWRHGAAKTLSRGMKQRLCFGRCLLHEPAVLLLDEPASGLDPAGRIEFRRMLKTLHEMGRTIVISSHILTEMADFCTSVGIIEHGRLLAGGRIGDILERLQSGQRLEIEAASEAAKLLDLLTRDECVSGAHQDGNIVRCRWTGPREALPRLHRAIVLADIPVIGFRVETDNLEDIYMRIAGHRIG